MLTTAFHLLKTSAIVACVVAFSTAIVAFITSIGSLLFPEIFKEVFYLISMFVPFNASVVFGAISISSVILLSFILADKIFHLSTYSIGNA